jgi:hypothetical protein
MDQVCIIAPLPLIKQAIIELSLAEWQQPRPDQVLMEEGAQATMAGRRQPFREEQGGHGIEACIVEAIHAGVGMAAVEEQDGLRGGIARPIEAILNEDAGLGGHKTMPSRSTCWVKGMARYRGESQALRL